MTVQYQGVWSLQSAAQLQSTQRWVTDPLFENTTLLLQADDAANGAQNNTFLDSSSNAFAITRNGNTTQGSFTPFSSQPGAWSAYCASSGNTLAGIFFNGESDFAFGSGDFTIEIFVNLSPSGALQVIYDSRPSGVNGLYPTIYLDNATTKIKYFTNSADRITQTSSFTYNVWHHIVVTRTGTNTKLFINGVQEGSTYVDSNTYINGASRPATSNGFAADSGVVGYISNLRVVKGSGPYQNAGSSITVPTAPLTPVTNTVLLTLQSNRFVDTNTQVAAKTINFASGPISVQAFSPFAPQFQWTPSVIGGSGYFDGTGDWINVADSTAFTLGSGNFTVEFWVYSTTAGIRQFISGQTNSAGANTAASFTIEKTSANKLLGSICSGSSSFAATSSGDIPLNAWTHIALVRDGNTLRQYINGVQDGTADVTGVTANDSSNQLSIGRLGEITTNNYFGYISNYRFVNGTAVYTGAFTPPIAPVTTSGPASSYSSTTNVNTTFTATNTALLTNFTNAGIYDGTMKNNLETVGNAQISTAVVKYGSGSMFFDGSGDRLFANTSPNLNLATGDWTIECWIYLNALNAFQMVLNTHASSSSTSGIVFGISNGNRIYIGNGVVLGTSGNTSLVSGAWYHIAAVRIGSNVSFYLNGVLDVTPFSFTPNAGGFLTVGANQAGSDQLNGYIDDLRVTRGIARYTQNFIPPSVALPRQ